MHLKIHFIFKKKRLEESIKKKNNNSRAHTHSFSRVYINKNQLLRKRKKEKHLWWNISKNTHETRTCKIRKRNSTNQPTKYTQFYLAHSRYYFYAKEMKSKEKSIWCLLWKLVFSSVCAAFFFLLQSFKDLVGIGKKKPIDNNNSNQGLAHLILVLSMPFLFQLSKRNVLLSVKMICRYFNEWALRERASRYWLQLSIYIQLIFTIITKGFHLLVFRRK